jgi:hypothetical protein
MENLYAALAKAQGEFPPVHFDAVGQARGGRYKYASLGAIWQAVRPTLAANGLSVVQLPTTAPDGSVGLRTVLAHASGETLESTATMPGGSTPQQQGSAYTYLRRYALAACLGIVAEDDDDGASASKPTPAQYPERGRAVPGVTFPPVKPAPAAPRPAPQWMLDAFAALAVPAGQIEAARQWCREAYGSDADKCKSSLIDMTEDGMQWTGKTFGRAG